MSELAVKMTGDEADLVARVLNVIRTTQSATQEFQQAAAASESTAKAAKEAAQQQQRLAAEGKRIAEGLKRENESLSDAYERQAKALTSAHEQGKLSAEELKTSLDQLEKKHESQAAANRQAALEGSKAWQQQQREAREGITIVERLEKKNQSLQQHYEELRRKIKTAFDQGEMSADRYRAAIDQLNREQAETATKTQEIGNVGDTVFSSGLKSLGAMAAGWLGVQTAIGLATSALDNYNEQKEKGRSETERLEDARRRLFQVSNGDFEELETRADSAATTFGVDRSKAREVLFTARSEGFEDQYETVMKLNPIISAESAATVAGQVRQLFKEENIDVGGAINGVLQAARQSRLDFEGVTRALPQVGEGGRQQKAGFDESLAAVSVLSSVFKSGETTGDRLKAFLSALALNEQTAGKGFIGGFEAVSQMSEDDRKAFLGSSQELNAVYAATTSFIEDIKNRASEISRARQAGAIDQTLAEFYGRPELASNQLAKAANALKEQTAETSYSDVASRNKAYLDFFQAQQNAGVEGYTGVEGFMNMRVKRLRSWMGYDIEQEAVANTDQELSYGADWRAFLEEQKKTNGLLEQSLKKPLVHRPGED